MIELSSRSSAETDRTLGAVEVGSNRQFQKVTIVGTSVSCPLSCRRQSTCAAPHLFLEEYKPRRSGLQFMQEPYQGAKCAHTGRTCHIRYCLLHQRCENCSINTLLTQLLKQSKSAYKTRVLLALYFRQHVFINLYH